MSIDNIPLINWALTKTVNLMFLGIHQYLEYMDSGLSVSHTVFVASRLAHSFDFANGPLHVLSMETTWQLIIHVAIDYKRSGGTGLSPLNSHNTNFKLYIMLNVVITDTFLEHWSVKDFLDKRLMWMWEMELCCNVCLNIYYKQGAHFARPLLHLNQIPSIT